jgi:hypothetical protein
LALTLFRHGSPEPRDQRLDLVAPELEARAVRDQDARHLGHQLALFQIVFGEVAAVATEPGKPADLRINGVPMNQAKLMARILGKSARRAPTRFRALFAVRPRRGAIRPERGTTGAAVPMPARARAGAKVGAGVEPKPPLVPTRRPRTRRPLVPRRFRSA